MQREADMLVPRLKDTLIETVDMIGIGGEDIPSTDFNDIIVNVGYAGGYRVPIGRVVEPTFFHDVDRYRCYTSHEFVTKPCTPMPSIYDMELNKLLKIPHKKLFSLKIVSDRLNEHECEMFDSDESWGRVVKILKGYF